MSALGNKGVGIVGRGGKRERGGGDDMKISEHKTGHYCNIFVLWYWYEQNMSNHFACKNICFNVNVDIQYSRPLTAGLSPMLRI